MSKNNEESIIEVKDLSKSFGDHEVLRKIDFEVKKGEVICILGSSGSGKSTLLRCVNKLETQTSGQVLYHGKEIRNVQKEINEFRSRVGMVFQSFNLFNNMTVLENCMEGARKGKNDDVPACTGGRWKRQDDPRISRDVSCGRQWLSGGTDGPDRSPCKAALRRLSETDGRTGTFFSDHSSDRF